MNLLYLQIYFKTGLKSFIKFASNPVFELLDLPNETDEIGGDSVGPFGG